MKRAVFGLCVLGCVAFVIAGRVSADSDAWRSESGEEFGQWSEAINLGAVVNSSVRDTGGSVSRDGLSLYFGSARAGATGSDSTCRAGSRSSALDDAGVARHAELPRFRRRRVFVQGRPASLLSRAAERAPSRLVDVAAAVRARRLRLGASRDAAVATQYPGAGRGSRLCRGPRPQTTTVLHERPERARPGHLRQRATPDGTWSDPEISPCSTARSKTAHRRSGSMAWR